MKHANQTSPPGGPNVSVVMGTLDRLPYLRCAVGSVREDFPSSECEIVVVDGGSQDGTVQWLEGREDVITIVQPNREERDGEAVMRRSWGHFMNLGFKRASAPYICMLSDDCVVLPGAIGSGLELIESADDIGAAAFYWRNWPIQRRYRVGYTWGGRMYVNHGLFRRDALADVGYIDEEGYRFHYADADLGLRLAEAGWRCVDSPDSYVEHYPYASPALGAKNAQIAKHDWSAFERRWGHLGHPDNKGWVERSYTDPDATARRWWGGRRILRSWVRRTGDRLRGLIPAARRRW